MKSKYEPNVYVALRNGGYSNRQIGLMLSVNEASVRRGLRSVGYTEPSRIRALLSELADRLEFADL